MITMTNPDEDKKVGKAIANLTKALADNRRKPKTYRTPQQQLDDELAQAGKDQQQGGGDRG